MPTRLGPEQPAGIPLVKGVARRVWATGRGKAVPIACGQRVTKLRVSTTWGAWAGGAIPSRWAAGMTVC